MKSIWLMSNWSRFNVYCLFLVFQFLPSAKIYANISCQYVFQTSQNLPSSAFSTYNIEQARIDLIANSSGVQLTMSTDRPLSVSLASLYPIVATALQIDPSTIQSSAYKINGTKKVELGPQQVANVTDLFTNVMSQLSLILDIDRQPISLSDVSDFDQLSPLEQWQETILPQISHPRFRQRYIRIYTAYMNLLPMALRTVLSTEFYLPHPNGESWQTATHLIMSAYSVNSEQAHSALEKLATKLVSDLQANQVSSSSLGGFHYYMGLIPFQLGGSTVSIPESSRVQYLEAPSDPHVTPDTVSSHDALLGVETTFEHSTPYLYRRRILIEDIDPEILDATHITTLKYYFHVEDIQQLAAQVSGRDLYYEVGLSRNEIRDLYFYLKNNYNVRLRLGELGYVLNILNPRYRPPQGRSAY
jgi:hypothetical protein